LISSSSVARVAAKLVMKIAARVLLAG